MMITGSPGAGKTMCANFILSKKNCDIVRMNANMVKTVSEVQAIISDKLLKDDSNRTAIQIIRELEEADYDKTCIIYIEEIEILFKTAPDIISEDFLLLFSKKNINLILIGISNTIDTLQKYSSKFSFKINDIENVVFQPYTCENIIMIMKDKLEQISKKTYLEI
jgi:Cdc6-like AAA superfamily ATPase